jgi:uncharacterized protein
LRRAYSARILAGRFRVSTDGIRLRAITKPTPFLPQTVFRRYVAPHRQVLMSNTPPESLLPYDDWAARALRGVAVDALEFAARNGLPGEHHFYISFRTDHPGTNIPGHLKARYPTEMTIVLQHRFWDLAVDRAAQRFSVGLSFSGVPSMLSIPFGALTAFQDPQANFGLRFEPDTATEPTPAAPAPEPPAAVALPAAETPQVVSLDAFRRKRD